MTQKARGTVGEAGREGGHVVKISTFRAREEGYITCLEPFPFSDSFRCLWLLFRVPSDTVQRFASAFSCVLKGGRPERKQKRASFWPPYTHTLRISARTPPLTSSPSSLFCCVVIFLRLMPSAGKPFRLVQAPTSLPLLPLLLSPPEMFAGLAG